MRAKAKQLSSSSFGTISMIAGRAERDHSTRFAPYRRDAPGASAMSTDNHDYARTAAMNHGVSPSCSRRPQWGKNQQAPVGKRARGLPLANQFEGLSAVIFLAFCLQGRGEATSFRHARGTFEFRVALEPKRLRPCNWPGFKRASTIGLSVLE